MVGGLIAGGLLGGGFGVLVMFGLHWIIIGMALQLITTREPDLDMLEVAIYSFYLAMGQKNPLEERKLAEEAAKAAAAAVTIDAPADPERGGEEAAESEAAPEAPEAPEAGEAPAEENR